MRLAFIFYVTNANISVLFPMYHEPRSDQTELCPSGRLHVEVFSVATCFDNGLKMNRVCKDIDTMSNNKTEAPPDPPPPKLTS